MIIAIRDVKRKPEFRYSVLKSVTSLFPWQPVFKFFYYLHIENCIMMTYYLVLSFLLMYPSSGLSSDIFS